jgi:hypothetical protein
MAQPNRAVDHDCVLTKSVPLDDHQRRAISRLGQQLGELWSLLRHDHSEPTPLQFSNLLCTQLADFALLAFRGLHLLLLPPYAKIAILTSLEKIQVPTLLSEPHLLRPDIPW